MSGPEFLFTLGCMMSACSLMKAARDSNHVEGWDLIQFVVWLLATIVAAGTVYG